MADYQILRTQFRVSDVVGWQRSGTLQLNPNFQRRSVWKKGAKSFLIDTIVRGLSMPIIFLRDLPADLRTLEAKRDVVDGQQRLRTVLSYVDPRLLKDFNPSRDDFRIDATHNEELGGKSFPQLPNEYKQKILDYQFSVHVFPADTDDREILQIFARMNATGLNLNAQELRNAEFFGKFKTLAYGLAYEQLNRWRDWHIFTPDQIARMNEVELTSEFLLMIIDGVLEKDNATIGAFYRDFDEKFPDETEVATRFRSVMDDIDSTFSENIERLFRNRTMFYALFATMYGLQFELRVPPEGRKPATGKLLENHIPLQKQSAKAISPNLVRRILEAAEKIKAEKTKAAQVPPEVLRATRGSTAHASPRRALIRYLAGDDADPCPPLR
ncbi:MAG: DUF262 domain-containing protein [Acetobacteraceae bacterium]